MLMTMAQVRTIFLQWIPWVLRMARPGEKITRKTIMMQVIQIIDDDDDDEDDDDDDDDDNDDDNDNGL